MKKILVLILMSLLVLTGCQEVFKGANLNDLNDKMVEYLDGSNQFEVEIFTKAETKQVFINDDGSKRYFTSTKTDKTEFNAQKEPYYIVQEYPYTTRIETMDGDDIIEHTIYDEFHVSYKNFYESNKIRMERSINPFATYEVETADIKVRKYSDYNYEISGKLVDFVPGFVLNDLEDELMILGLTQEEINKIEVKIVYFFNGEEFKYTLSFSFELNQKDFTITVSTTFTYNTFEVIDITDETKYTPLSVINDVITLNDSEQISFRYKAPMDMTYYKYLEPGLYGFNTSIRFLPEVTITLTDESYDANEYRVFRDIYNPDDSNDYYPYNIDQYYEIKEAGYYYINVTYPNGFTNYVIDLIPLGPLKTENEPIDLVVKENGTYDYQLEKGYDFFTVSLDFEQDAIVEISSSEGIHLFYHQPQLNSTYYSNRVSDKTNYLYLNDSLLYFHSPYQENSGQITFEFKPFVHGFSLDDELLELKESLNEDYFYTGFINPIQYAKLTVTEKATYTFHVDILSGIDYLGGALLLDENNQKVGEISDQTVLTLEPGTYYYKTTNANHLTYTVYVTKA